MISLLCTECRAGVAHVTTWGGSQIVCVQCNHECGLAYHGLTSLFRVSNEVLLVVFLSAIRSYPSL